MFQFFPNNSQERDGGHENIRPIGRGANGPARPLAALPLEVQRVEKALRLDPIFDYVERRLHNLKRKRQNDCDYFSRNERDTNGSCSNFYDDDIETSRDERRANRKRLYNTQSLCDSRKWMKDVLISDVISSDDDISDTEKSDFTPEKADEYVRRLLKEHSYTKRCLKKFHKLPVLEQRKCMHYGSGLVLDTDPFSEFPDLSTLNSKQEKVKKTPKSCEDKNKHKAIPKIKVEQDLDDFSDEVPMQNFYMDEDEESDEDLPSSSFSTPLTKRQQQIFNNNHINNNDTSKSVDLKPKLKPKKSVNPEQMAAKRRKLWTAISKKDVPRMHKHKSTLRKDNLASLRKVARECQRECRKVALVSQKQSKEASTKARRLAKEMQAYWKRFEKVEKEHRKKAEKEALEQKKMDMEMKEMLRQQRKLNFLIAQTELYAHFMAGKLSGGVDNSDGSSESRCEEILRRFDEVPNNHHHLVNKQRLVRKIDDEYDSQQMKDMALNNVKTAIEAQRSRVKEFDMSLKLPSLLNPPVEATTGSAFSDPSINKVGEWKQPNIFRGTLKSYQLKGMNWIANLYDQGINGILADEMGLGKTVQSVAFLAHLAEEQGIWGPFLVVAPASTLHNWLQEMTKFVPGFKVIPYWGTTQDRKVLRKFWNKGINKHDLPTKESSFHVVITSYQMVVQDAKYFQQINWHYMVLDEAQAIKSSNSSRWKSLLVFKCRNRLLLTGTPIQNSMAELWALLHFIMPTLFDSHEEFSEWFAKDIENHVERQSSIDANQLSRLHMILKPFMLRRVKKDVENELSDKIEIQVCCPLTRRQRLLYKAIKNKISIDDLLQSSSLSVSVTNSLMNIVMQLRKVCNHPELFERRDLKSPCFVNFEPYCMPKLIYREGWLTSLNPDRHHLLMERLNVFNHHSIHRSLFHECSEDGRTQSSFSFTRFTDLSVAELCSVHKGGHVRWLHHLRSLKSNQLTYHQRHISENVPSKRVSYSRFLLDLNHPTSVQSIASSDVLGSLCFVRSVGDVYAICDHTINFMNESFEHRKMRLRHSIKNDLESTSSVPSPCPAFSSSPLADEDSCPGLQLKTTEDEDTATNPHLHRQPYKRQLVPTSIPAFLLCLNPKVICKGSTDYYTFDRSAQWDRRREFDSAYNYKALQCLNYGSPEVKDELDSWKRHESFSLVPALGGFVGSAPTLTGYSGISLPGKEMLVTDAGKLTILDGLLTKLKTENHRVLIYSQMTKMIDILEEFLWHRRHTYMRLDGSSKISERRDMVADFQTRSDIFIFLLSTRAGGLGINLTAADTVIFYDSDWNPTVDQQAMDRAHRLGQTKQVTVYRLVCEGTIEERILQRAKEKSEIQRMVISGGEFAPDILKPKEVVTLLLDDEEMARRVCQKQEQRRARDELRRDLGLVESRKRPRSKTGRGPGRPPKRFYLENNNMLLSDAGGASESPAYNASSISYPPSPSEERAGLNRILQSENFVEEKNDSPSVHGNVTPKLLDVREMEVPRKRGRPKGSTSSNTANPNLAHSRPRGRGSIQKSLSAAEAAALSAAKQAALAAHGYNYSAKKPSSSPS